MDGVYKPAVAMAASHEISETGVEKQRGTVGPRFSRWIDEALHVLVKFHATAPLVWGRGRRQRDRNPNVPSHFVPRRRGFSHDCPD